MIREIVINYERTKLPGWDTLSHVMRDDMDIDAIRHLLWTGTKPETGVSRETIHQATKDNK